MGTSVQMRSFIEYLTKQYVIKNRDRSPILFSVFYSGGYVVPLFSLHGCPFGVIYDM